MCKEMTGSLSGVRKYTVQGGLEMIRAAISMTTNIKNINTMYKSNVGGLVDPKNKNP